MARAGLTPEIVVDLALAIVDEHGLAAVTLSAVAARAGVATPSLYKHVRNLAELAELVSIRVMDQLADRGYAAVAGPVGRRCAARLRRRLARATPTTIPADTPP